MISRSVNVGQREAVVRCRGFEGSGERVGTAIDKGERKGRTVPSSEHTTSGAASVQEAMVIEARGKEGANFGNRRISQLCFLKTNKMRISVTTGIKNKNTFFIIIKASNVPRYNIEMLKLTSHDNLAHQG
jgi:hypothetical protein